MNEKRCAQCGEMKPVDDFPLNASRSTGHGAACKPCHCVTANARYERNKARMRDRSRERTFGLAPGEYAAMLEAQGGVCAICGEPETLAYRGELRALAVDHAHDTGQVRALLCCACNQAIGLCREQPKILLAAAEYLRAWGR